MNNQSNISAIAWDLDNTLFDRDAAFRRLLTAWLAGQTKLEAEGDAIRKMTAQLMLLDQSGYGDRMEVCREAAAMAGSLVPAGDLRAEIHQRLADFVSPDRRTTDLLRTLSRRFPMAVVTNGAVTLQRAKIARAGLSPFFPADAVIISAEVGFEKPDARIFKIAEERLGVPASEVLFIGDHVENDIAGAARAGPIPCASTVACGSTAIGARWPWTARSCP